MELTGRALILQTKLTEKAKKANTKVDRSVYLFLAGVFLKGGFDISVSKSKEIHLVEGGQSDIVRIVSILNLFLYLQC